MILVLWGLARRLRLPALTERYPRRLVLGVFALVNGLISVGLLAGAAWATGSPLVFPSLSPTAFLIFYPPLAPAACPRNLLGGHLIGVLAGYLGLVVFGLTDAGSAIAAGVTGPRVGAAALSLGLTSGAMVWARLVHPPAGATTLIVSLGVLTTPAHLGVLLLAVALLAVQGLAINRLAGVDYPVWSPSA
jgi:CBS-domain-containing membrane protein